MNGAASRFGGTLRGRVPLRSPRENLQQTQLFLAAVDVLLPDESTPELYGRISAQLALAGTSIPQKDIWIAAIAVQSDLQLATADRHFQHVIGLTVLLW